MRRAGLDASIDLTTAMLIKLTQALKLSEALPPESGRSLERMAKAVRLFCEARETGSAADLVDQMLAMLPEDDVELAEARAALSRATTRVLSCIGFMGVQRARQDAQRGTTEAA